MMIAEINSEEDKRPVKGTCLWSAWDEMRMIMISKTIEIQICKQERKHTLLDLNFKI